MPFLLLLGLLPALAQHLFYSYIDGLSPEGFIVEQKWVIRIGTALAYLFKTSLVATTAVVFYHRSWYSFRRQAMSVRGLDAVFGVFENPFWFLTREMLVKTKVAAVLALMSWLLPLTAIFSPASLTGRCPLISMLILVISGKNIFIQNAVSALDGWVNFYEFLGTLPPSFAGPTPSLKRLAMSIFTGGQIIPWSSPCGANCTYVITFDGPAYNCSDTIEPSPTDIAPNGNVLYLTSPGMVDLPQGASVSNFTTTARFSDGIWIRRNLWDGVIHTTHCKLHSSTYHLNVTYLENIQTIISNVAFHDQIFGSIFLDLTNFKTGAVKYNSSTLNHTQSLVNFYALEQSVQGLLQGFLRKSQMAAGFNINGTAQIQLWKFVDYGKSPSLLSYPDNFAQTVQDLMTNVTLSLIHLSQNPLPPSDVALGGSAANPATNTTAIATMTTYPTRYNYSASTLWEIYGVALGLVAGCMMFGWYMLFVNGVNSDMSFSQILVTTRNSTLDNICAGAGLGGETISDTILKTKLKYGELVHEPDEMGGNHAFGLEEEVTRPKK
jgi:hypothetical protein